MIFGDPFLFSIQIDIVKEWNAENNYWRNGLISLYLNGSREFSLVDACEIRTNFYFYKKINIDGYFSGVIDDSYYLIFNSINSYYSGYSENIIPGSFYLSCTAMEDAGYYFYLIRKKEKDFILWSNNHGKDVFRADLPPDYIKSVILDMSKYEIDA
ncbi:Imm42 family immunity protein [Novispirillum itersonii]|uniref:Imm42 family immunity protein n=1 Tax=Novispirillum itersonii TaxID=189 RepID=UPI0009DBD4C7|nr:Imm42 family immunity protein [Novispirillum itersonii]